MAKETCNCAPNQTSGRDFVREIEYLRNVAPVIEAGEQKRKTISHSCKVIPDAVLNIGLGMAIGGIGITLTALGVNTICDFIDNKLEKRAEKKKKKIKEEEQN